MSDRGERLANDANKKLRIAQSTVASLGRQYDQMHKLTSEIIATLSVNRERGLLIVLNSEGAPADEESETNQLLDDLIAGWKRRLRSAEVIQ